MAAELLSDIDCAPVVIPQRTDLRVVRHARREERQAKAMRLAWLGWTQKEIGEALGVSQQAVSEDAKNGEVAVSSILDMHTKGVPTGEIATRLNLPDILVWTAPRRDSVATASQCRIRKTVSHREGVNSMCGTARRGGGTVKKP